MMLERIHSIVSYITLTVGLILILWIGYMMIYPIRVVTFDRPGHIDIQKGDYYPGSLLPVRYPFYKYVATFPEIHRRLINSTVYQLPVMFGSSGIGRHEEWYYMTEIPKYLPPGVYRLAIDFVFKFNFLREYRVSLMSDPFVVKPHYPDMTTMEKKSK
jgi:hypothetical protein